MAMEFRLKSQFTILTLAVTYPDNEIPDPIESDEGPCAALA
jgi:hypothetical protein